ncbi:MAG: SGNH/GDSL hydrolase family protein [Bacillota bacterium]
MFFAPHTRLVIIGDSITDCGRARPVGEGAGLGDGYVRYIDALLTVEYPELKLRVTNMGVSGNTVRDLAERWERGVLALAPDYLAVMIGTNDVWRHFDASLRPETWVGPEDYERTYTGLIERTLPLLKGLILMTPFFIEPNKADPMRAMMDRYGEIVKGLALRYGAVLVDTQAAFDRLLAHYHSYHFAYDRIHPNHIGHMVLAKAFVEAVERAG